MRDNFFGDAGWDDLEYDEWVQVMNQFLKEANRVLKKKRRYDYVYVFT